jgi:hypothetical protein
MEDPGGKLMPLWERQIVEAIPPIGAPAVALFVWYGDDLHAVACYSEFQALDFTLTRLRRAEQRVVVAGVQYPDGRYVPVVDWAALNAEIEAAEARAASSARRSENDADLRRLVTPPFNADGKQALVFADVPQWVGASGSPDENGSPA